MQILSSLSPLALEHEGGTAVAMGFLTASTSATVR